MAKSNTTTYPTLTLLLGALIFTLSAIPGVNSEVEVGSISLSSDCATLGVTLDGAESAECQVQAGTGGQRVRAKKLVKPKELGQAAERTVVELETEAQAVCATCVNGVRSSPVKVTVEIADVPNLKTIAERIVQESTRKLAADIKADTERAARVEKCEEDELGNKMEGMSAIMECRVNKLKGMDRRKAEAYFDKHIRKQLQDMISGTDGQDPALRAGNRAAASELVATLKENLGESAYLKASVAEIQRFGQAHVIADAILAKQAQVAAMPAGSRERLILQQEIVQLSGQFNADRTYFASRGVQIAPQLSGIIEASQVTNLQADLDAYQRSLDAVANQHRQYVGNRTPITPGATQSGVRPYGTDPRQSLGAPVTAYPSMPGAPGNGVAQQQPGQQQPMRPGMNTAPGQRGPFPQGGRRVIN